MSKSSDALDYVANYYQGLLAKHGETPRAVDWRNEDQMNLRFAALSQIGNLKGCSIADIGSGFGDLYGYLRKLGWDGEYTGFELIPRFVAIARQKYPGVEFVEGDFLSAAVEKRYDWVLLSGSLNYRFDGVEEFTSKMIEKMYSVCKLGVGFNLMSTYVDFQNEITSHNEPEKIFKFCKSLTRFVALRHDYHPWEFTTYMFKRDMT